MTDSTRLDKWLWAARFFKTRSLAKQAIEGGKVHYDGDRCKVSKQVAIGAELQIRQGLDEKTVIVLALSDRRGPASVAQTLYRETEQSLAAREQQADRRRQQKNTAPDSRPDKKDRRQIMQLKQHQDH
ncbi:MAG TPA: S4 domain-containing protein [Pseudomonadales bacterium]